jgi:Protein of unknown function (DUF2635)
MPRLWLKPTDKDLKIRLPHNPRQYLPPEGMDLEVDQFWWRRVLDGDVEPVENTQEQKE